MTIPNDPSATQVAIEAAPTDRHKRKFTKENLEKDYGRGAGPFYIVSRLDELEKVFGEKPLRKNKAQSHDRT